MLSTKELMTVPIRPLVDRTYLEQVLLSRFSHGEVQQWVQKYFQPYRELMSYYRCAIMEVETKFNVLNEELSLQYDRNPIETRPASSPPRASWKSSAAADIRSRWRASKRI